MSDTLMKSGSGMVERQPDSSAISFVSYFSFASKRLETSKVHSYLVARNNCDAFFARI